MIAVSRHVAILDGESEITAIRVQGADGQHVNRTSTAIHLRFDVRVFSLSEYYKERLLATGHHLISSDGVTVIKAQEYRSQELNRKAVLVQLAAVIKGLITEQKARRSTRPTHASKEYRLASKAQEPSVKAMRGKVRSGRK